ncbi:MULTISPECIES: 50S ribosomal protein L9 [Gudongella]|jgi:large subunit ribosomal protein L9|uniref:50S ribosomal protein L9 n=1 Tax=Gudongella oleilytica TaxID=1582259 RepID=UPI002A36C5EE|nr:50S ribosomal protein L9 [Gudongella oleilytica]MDY0258013.1 50S ribosomal protein L9 [Gudongella oleilytica]
MKVILLKEVKGMGKEGDLVNSKDGYARNYLIPRNIAIEATSENLRKWEEAKKQEAAKKKQELEEAKSLKERLEKLTVEVKAKGGSGGRLFGSITSQDIAAALKEQHGVDIDKRKIEMKDNIKNAGAAEVDLKLYPEVSAKLKVNVVTI